MTQSMSRVGRCIDNGPIESYWGTLKCEKYYLHKHDSYEELKLAIDDYIHFYNDQRRKNDGINYNANRCYVSKGTLSIGVIIYSFYCEILGA